MPVPASSIQEATLYGVTKVTLPSGVVSTQNVEYVPSPGIVIAAVLDHGELPVNPKVGQIYLVRPAP